MLQQEAYAAQNFETPASTPFIICDNLVKIYKVANLEVFALQGLDLVVETGELLGIVGASGSGKSTLMNILGGLDRPSAGQVSVGGNDLLKLSDSALNRYRRDQVGFVWQQSARNLVAYLNAQENVALPMILAGQVGRRARHRADALLEAVGLADRRQHRIAQLSGGEQQRVAIAVALANHPPLLLADEPTGEVDTVTAQAIYDTFRTLNQEYQLTTLIVTHDPAIAHQVDRVVAIRDGKLASETVRRPGNSASDSNHDPERKSATDEQTFEELVVVDSAGRLQIPKAFLEAWHIQNRVKLESVEDGILIRPSAPPAQPSPSEAQPTEVTPQAKTNGWQQTLTRWRNRKNSVDFEKDKVFRTKRARR